MLIGDFLRKVFQLERVDAEAERILVPLEANGMLMWQISNYSYYDFLSGDSVDSRNGILRYKDHEGKSILLLNVPTVSRQFNGREESVESALGNLIEKGAYSRSRIEGEVERSDEARYVVLLNFQNLLIQKFARKEVEIISSCEVKVISDTGASYIFKGESIQVYCRQLEPDKDIRFNDFPEIPKDSGLVIPTLTDG